MFQGCVFYESSLTIVQSIILPFLEKYFFSRMCHCDHSIHISLMNGYEPMKKLNQQTKSFVGAHRGKNPGVPQSLRPRLFPLRGSFVKRLSEKREKIYGKEPRFCFTCDLNFSIIFDVCVINCSNM